MKNLADGWMENPAGDSPSEASAPSEIEIFDVQGALSQEFLRRRGFCCGNDCKNCPYDCHDA